MFIDENGTTIENAQEVTEEEFWKKVFGYDTNQIQQDAISLLTTLDEIIMDRIGENIEITTGVVLEYNKKRRSAKVNLVTNIDYQVNAILKNDNAELQRQSILSKQILTVYNFSIFDDLTVGTPVIIIKPQGGYQFNYFIIGVLHPQNYISIIDKFEKLSEQLKQQETKITNLENEIKSLKSSISSLKSITTTTTTT